MSALFSTQGHHIVYICPDIIFQILPPYSRPMTLHHVICHVTAVSRASLSSKRKRKIVSVQVSYNSRWKDVNSLVLISNILFNFLINSATNCSPWSKTILFSNSCNFHILFLDNLTNSSANISFAVTTKYVILDNLLQTTRIISFPAIRCGLH